jgi:hypothetical protein
MADIKKALLSFSVFPAPRYEIRNGAYVRVN